MIVTACNLHWVIWFPPLYSLVILWMCFFFPLCFWGMSLVLYQPTNIIDGSLTPSVVHFFSNVKPQYYDNNIPLQYDYKRQGNAVQMSWAECSFEQYYIPQAPKWTDFQFYPSLPDEYLQTLTYKLLCQSELMFDSLIMYGNHMYEYVDFKNTNTGINGLIDDLKEACKHFIMWIQYIVFVMNILTFNYANIILKKKYNTISCSIFSTQYCRSHKKWKYCSWIVINGQESN